MRQALAIDKLDKFDKLELASFLSGLGGKEDIELFYFKIVGQEAVWRRSTGSWSQM